ncbi:uncharacterized protein LOC135818897 [Sycon ciliatum]|uniref:uncharacterized protein LOC135818897 n=1 Tax=Sycon ciliatum TaxID=27933 RepID=UPI0031F6EAEB
MNIPMKACLATRHLLGVTALLAVLFVCIVPSQSSLSSAPQYRGIDSEKLAGVQYIHLKSLYHNRPRSPRKSLATVCAQPRPDDSLTPYQEEETHILDRSSGNFRHFCKRTTSREVQMKFSEHWRTPEGLEAARTVRAFKLHVCLHPSLNQDRRHTVTLSATTLDDEFKQVGRTSERRLRTTAAQCGWFHNDTCTFSTTNAATGRSNQTEFSEDCVWSQITVTKSVRKALLTRHESVIFFVTLTTPIAAESETCYSLRSPSSLYSTKDMDINRPFLSFTYKDWLSPLSVAGAPPSTSTERNGACATGSCKLQRVALNVSEFNKNNDLRLHLAKSTASGAFKNGTFVYHYCDGVCRLDKGSTNVTFATLSELLDTRDHQCQAIYKKDPLRVHVTVEAAYRNNLMSSTRYFVQYDAESCYCHGHRENRRNQTSTRA